MLCIQYEDLLLEISTVVIAIANRKFNIVREVKEPDPSRSIRNPVEQEIDLLKKFPKKNIVSFVKGKLLECVN